MTKRFYKLMCMAAAAAMTIIGCGEDDPAPEYGVPTDLDTTPVTDHDQGWADEYGPVQTDYYEEQPDADEPVILPDDPAMEYGPVQVDYDELATDAIIEQPDEMTTDYGPISQPFKK